jgi:hypothetical protein
VAAGGGVVGLLMRAAGLGQPKESERGGFIRAEAAKTTGTAKAAQAQEQTS